MNMDYGGDRMLTPTN